MPLGRTAEAGREKKRRSTVDATEVVAEMRAFVRLSKQVTRTPSGISIG